MRLRVSSLLIPLALSAVCAAQDAKVEKFKLPNGLTVILHEDHRIPQATINTWFYVGSKDEAARRSGFAHLFEHLMFMGTERVPGNSFDVLMERGGGWNNASTWEDFTNYYSLGPSNLLKTLLWLDADRLEDIGRMMTKEKLDLQREVVRNERRQSVELQPYGKAYEALPRLLFPSNHPYSTSVIGSHEDLQAASVEDVKDFFATFYVPNNASLVIAGDFKTAEIKPYVEKIFGSIPRRNDPPRKDFPDPTLTETKRVTMVDDVAFDSLIVAYHSPAAYQPGDIEMKMASSILADGVSSRLYQRLVVKDQLATEVSAFPNSLIKGGYFVFHIVVAEGKKVEDVRKALDEELKTFSQSGPTEKELKQISSALEREVLTSFQDLRSRADKMNEYQYFWGEPNSFKRDIERVKAVTRENVRKTASEVFSKHRVEITVIPTDTPNRKDRDEKPTIDKEPDFAAPTSQDFTLSNGISVTYFRQDDLPLTEISVAVGYGSHHDPRNKAGLAALLGEMLTAGTGTLDAKAYQEQLDLLGASVSVNTSPTQTLINLSALTSNLDESINLFASALTKPAFLEKEFNRIKDLSIQSIKADLEEPTAIASIVAAKYYFGDQHPAGVPASGTLSTLKGIQLEDLKKAYAIAFNSGNAKIFAAGNLSADELKVKLEKALGTWNKGTALPKLTYPKLEQKPLTVLLVDVPDAPQTVIRFRFPGVTYTDPDRQAIEAIGTLFGGTFTSRLNANLREDKGYTYGAGARSSSTLYYGTFEANASVREDATGASLKEFLAEFNKLQQGDITDEETEKAISSKKADIVNVFGTLSGIVSAAQEMATYGKTVKDLVAERNQLSTLNTAKLNALVKKALQSNYGVLVLVGDKEKILPQLEGLNLPKPIEVDLEKD